MKVKSFARLFLLQIVIIGLTLIVVNAAEPNGKCGESVSWSYDETTGVLNISGYGDMEDYADQNDLPWYSLKNDIKHIVVEDGVASLGNRAFMCCRNAESIALPDSLTEIGDYVFYECFKLENVDIPKSVHSVGERAFYACWAFEEMVFPDSVQSIGKSAFMFCKGIKKVTLPNSLQNIENAMFMCCESLEEVNIPNTVKSIGEDAFSDCYSLKKLEIPSAVEKIGNGAFAYCESLQEINLPDAIKFIGEYCLAACKKIKEIKIPENVTIIGANAFYGCSGITEIKIPEGVTDIKYRAFNGCVSLARVVFPGSLRNIADKAFEGCPSLETIHYMGTGLEWENINIVDADIQKVMLHCCIQSEKEAADCSNEGYEGDWYCDICKTIISKGQIIAKDPEKHNSSYYESGICSCGALDARAVGSSLTLEGSIEISYYFEMSEAIYNNPSAKVRFTFGDGRVPLEVPVRDGTIDIKSVPGKTLYVYGCDVFAKQMTDMVTAQVILDGAKSEEYAHSIKNYARLLIESDNYPDSCVALVKAMINYGAYAQKHFGYHVERLANEILNEADRELEIDASVFDAYKPSGSENEAVGKFIGADLILESETTLEVYFSPAEGKDSSDLSFTVDGKKVGAKVTASGYVIEIANIAAQDIDKAYKVTVSDGNVTSTYEISALSYCAAVMGRAPDEIYTEALRDAIKALYLYNDAANKYFGDQ